MERIVNNINSADKSTKEAVKQLEEAVLRIPHAHYHVTNNIYTDSSSSTAGDQSSGNDVNNSTTIKEKLLDDIVKHFEKIIEVKDAQIELMLDTLTDNKDEIKRLRERLSEYRHKLTCETKSE